MMAGAVRGAIPDFVDTGSSALSFTVTVKDSVRSSSWPEGALSLRMILSCTVCSPFMGAGALM